MKSNLKELYLIARQFNFKSIFFKYWRKFTVIITIPFLILNLFIYFLYTQSNSEKAANSFAKSASFAYDSLSRQLDNADKIFAMISENHYISSYMLAAGIDEDYKPQQMLQAMNQHLISTPELHSISLYKSTVPYVLSTDGGAGVEDFEYLDWLEHYEKTGDSNFLMHGRIYDYLIRKDRDILTFCYGLYRNQNCLGLVTINYNFYALNNLLTTQNEEHLYLIDNHGEVLYSNNLEMVGKALSESYDYAPPQSKLSFQGGLNYLTASCSFAVKPLHMVIVANSSAYNNLAVTLGSFFLTVIVAGILLPLLLTFYITLSFYRPITKILIGFSGSMLSGQTPLSSDEIDFIINQVANLSDKNQYFEKELASKMVLLKESQFSAMQLQFNQHFLFNTLNLISMTARNTTKEKSPNGKNPTSTAISLLSDLLRISLDTEQYIVSLYKEIAYAKKYIEIEQLKLKNCFEVQWDIDENVYECKVIKFILQPIIENALRYGLNPLPAHSRKSLRITSETRPDSISIHVIDNGTGFEPETLDTIQRVLQNEAPSGTSHIGIANVHRRIQLIFGDMFGLKITSNANGTDVEILLPLNYRIGSNK